MLHFNKFKSSCITIYFYNLKYYVFILSEKMRINIHNTTIKYIKWINSIILNFIVVSCEIDESDSRSDT